MTHLHNNASSDTYCQYVFFGWQLYGSRETRVQSLCAKCGLKLAINNGAVVFAHLGPRLYGYDSRQ